MVKNDRKFNAADGAKVFLFAVVSNLAVQVIVSVAAAAAMLNGINLIDNAIFNFALMLAIQAAFVGVYLWVLKKDGVEYPPVNHKVRFKPWAIAVAVLIGFVSILAFYPATLWVGLVLERTGFSGGDIPAMRTPAEFIFGVAVLVIAAPIGEELVFRGALLSSLKMRCGVKKAVILSALGFMLMHMNPAQNVYQFMLGIVLALAALATTSVIVPMVIHAASNLAAFLLDYTVLGSLAESFIEYFYSHIFLGVLVSIAFTAVFSFAVLLLLKLLYDKHKSIPIKVSQEDAAQEGGQTSPEPIIYGQAGYENTPFGELLPAVNSVLEGTAVNVKSKAMYFGTIAICSLMWIVNLIAGIVME